MWAMGVPIELYRQINPQDRVYTETNFLAQHQLAKYSLVLIQLTLSVGLILGLKAILGLKKALLGVALFTFEPFFLGNSRLLHMDVLLTLLTALALTYGYKHYMRRSVTSLILAGIFAGLAFLTKSVGILSLGSISTLLLAAILKNRSGRKRSMVYLGTFLLSSVATIFILFPALWVNPKFVLTDIFSEGLRIGTRNGHEQLVMDEVTDSAGPTFYPLVLALKISPLIWAGIGLFIFQLVRNRRRYQRVDKKFVLYLTAFYMIYFFGMTLASKKIDRYMLPLFPLFGIVSAIGVSQAVADIKGRHRKNGLYAALMLITGMGIVYPLVTLYPYYFTYTNPLFGPAENANKIIGQKPFGIGIPELKTRLETKYGSNVPLGFIDKKPMSMIYPNSKLFDIRETGSSKYNLIILGPNEELPEKVTDGKYNFIQDDAMYINGLEFWRVYKKVV
jgi:hypothetical protein